MTATEQQKQKGRHTDKGQRDADGNLRRCGETATEQVGKHGERRAQKSGGGQKHRRAVTDEATRRVGDDEPHKAKQSRKADGGGRRDHALYWTGNPRRPFSDESAFGILVFDP